MASPLAGPPRLLVSVRNVSEARAALAGGCDLVDVKEPNRGSLGMADAETIVRVVGDVKSAAETAGVPVSAALGETIDWLDPNAVPVLPAALDFLKLGLAGSGPDWLLRWRQVRERFELAAGTPFRWIAVAYADWELCCGPRPEAVLEAAAATGCAGLLLDTHAKSQKTLLDWVCAEQLGKLTRRVQRHGLQMAVAGRLRADLLSNVAAVHPDIVAIRTAGCRGCHRSGEIAAEAVRAFKAALTADYRLRASDYGYPQPVA